MPSALTCLIRRDHTWARLDDKVENHFFFLPDKFLKKTLGKLLQLAQCTFRLCFLGLGFTNKNSPTIITLKSLKAREERWEWKGGQRSAHGFPFVAGGSEAMVSVAWQGRRRQHCDWKRGKKDMWGSGNVSADDATLLGSTGKFSEGPRFVVNYTVISLFLECVHYWSARSDSLRQVVCWNELTDLVEAWDGLS